MPRLVKAALSNPCAAKKMGGSCNPCNPCAATKPCNPCAVANPCKPCAATNPCNPCGAGEAPELTDAEADAAYACLDPELRNAREKSGLPVATAFRSWQRYSSSAYQSDAHGMRYVHNYANDKARDYGLYEDAGTMPEGSIAAKDSFVLSMDGKVGVGPLFIMEKGAAGSSPVARDWTYAMIMPNGAVQDSRAIQTFCNDCHQASGAEDDYLMFLPDEYRVIKK